MKRVAPLQWFSRWVDDGHRNFNVGATTIAHNKVAYRVDSRKPKIKIFIVLKYSLTWVEDTDMAAINGAHKPVEHWAVG